MAGCSTALILIVTVLSSVQCRSVIVSPKSEIFLRKITTPSCLAFYNVWNITVCCPSYPKNMIVTTEYYTDSRYLFSVSWDKPTHFPNNYEMTIIDSKNEIKQNLLLNGTKNSVQVFAQIDGWNYKILLAATSTGCISTRVYSGKFDGIDVPIVEIGALLVFFILIFVPLQRRTKTQILILISLLCILFLYVCIFYLISDNFYLFFRKTFEKWNL